MYSQKTHNLFSKLLPFYIFCFFGLVSFASTKVITKKPNAILITALQKTDTIRPMVTSYSKLKNYNANNGYNNNGNTKTNNVTSYSSINNFNVNKGYNNNGNTTTSNVTSYSKLKNYNPKSATEEKTTQKIYTPNTKVYTTPNAIKYSKSKEKKVLKQTSNATSYSKLKKKTTNIKYTTNVTTYKKPFKKNNLKKAVKKIDIKPLVKTPPKRTSNVISYKKLNPKKVIVPKTEEVIDYEKVKIIHSNPILNKATNINDVSITTPIFPGCENELSEFDKKKCFGSKTNEYVIANFNNKSFKNKGVKKGVKNVRVLYVVDENGQSEATKIIGEWNTEVLREVRRVVKSLPKMVPGKRNNINITVKYSFLIPFIVK